jgi:hypothetical protein
VIVREAGLWISGSTSGPGEIRRSMWPVGGDEQCSGNDLEVFSG